MPGIVNQIYIYSRFRTFDSKSTSNFKIELKENYLVPDNYGAVITDITLPRTWYTINENNQNFFFRIWAPVLGYTDYRAPISLGNYDIKTLKDALVNAMNVVYMTVPGLTAFTGSYDLNNGTISITHPTVRFNVLTDKDLINLDFGNTITQLGWLGPQYDKTALRSINSVLSNINDGLVDYNVTKPFKTGVINTLPYEYLYITCNQLSSFENIGPRGERSLLKKVMVNEPFGGLINDNWFNEFDFADVSKQLLRTLEFRVVDPYGYEVNLNGAEISFSIGLIDISMHRT